MRRLLLMVFMVPVLSGASTTIDLTLASSTVGTNTYTIAADGTFNSITKATLGPQIITSTLADLFVSTSVKDATFHIVLFDPKGNWTIVAQPGQRRIGWKDGRFGPVQLNHIKRIQIEP